MKATFLYGKPDTLAIELNKRPRYKRQPRKETEWRICDDFTSGQSIMHRRHFLTFEEGTLPRHYRKLVLSDQRLYCIFQSHFPSCESEFFQNDRSRPNDLCHSNQPRISTDTRHFGMLNQTDGPYIPAPYYPMPPLTPMNRGLFNSQLQGDFLHSVNSNGAMISGVHDNFSVWNQGVMNNEGASSARGSQIHGQNPMSVFTTTDSNVAYGQVVPPNINSTCLPMLNEHHASQRYPLLPPNANFIPSVANSSMTMMRDNQTMMPHRTPQENFYAIADGRIQEHIPCNVSSTASMPYGEHNLVDPTRSMTMGGYKQNMRPDHTVPLESVYLTAKDQIQGQHSTFADFGTLINGGHYPYGQNSTTQEMLPPELDMLDDNEHNFGGRYLFIGAEPDQSLHLKVR